MKKCATEGCNNEVQAWQNFCDRHYQEIMQQQSGGVVVEQPPIVPEQKVKMPKARPIQSEERLPQFTTTTVQTKTEHPVEMSDKDRQYLRKECLKCAVDMLVGSEGLNKPYEQLMSEFATLVDDFYRIVTTKK